MRPLLLLALLLAARPSAAEGAPEVSGRAVAQVWTLPPEELDSLVREAPLYAGEKDGSPVVALNLVFLGQRELVRQALRCAGWFEVGFSVWEDFKQGLDDAAHHRRVEHFPPFSSFYVDGRLQDLNEARATGLTSRHHFRLWERPQRDSIGRPVWLGAGDYDEAVRWRHIDHVAAPEIDRERDFIADSLRACPMVERLSLREKPGLPARSFEGHRHFITDRRVLVVELKPVYLPAPVPPGLR